MTPPPAARLVLAAALGVPLAAGGCRPGASNRTPTRVSGVAATKRKVPSLSVPGHKVEGWSRAALARATYAAVLAPADDPRPRGERFAGRIDYGGWAVIGESMPPPRRGRTSDADDDARDRFERTWKAAFDDDTPARGAWQKVDRDALTRAGIAPPAGTAWLVSDAAICLAKLEMPLASRYASDGGRDALEIAWRPEGCSPDEDWAPVAIIAPSLPEDVRWVPAEVSLDVQLPVAEGWQGPLADALEAPVWRAEDPPPLEVVRVLSIPGLAATAVQVYDSLLRPAVSPDDPGPDGAGPGSVCADQSVTLWSHGFWDGAYFEAFDPAPDEPVTPHLRGAFVRDEQIDALVYEIDYDILVVVPPAPTEAGPTPWQRHRLGTGLRTPDELATWGYLPGGGVEPTGPACN